MLCVSFAASLLGWAGLLSLFSSAIAAPVAARAAKWRRQRTTLVWISCDGSRCAPCCRSGCGALGRLLWGRVRGENVLSWRLLWLLLCCSWLLLRCCRYRCWGCNLHRNGTRLWCGCCWCQGGGECEIRLCWQLLWRWWLMYAWVGVGLRTVAGAGNCEAGGDVKAVGCGCRGWSCCGACGWIKCPWCEAGVVCPNCMGAGTA